MADGEVEVEVKGKKEKNWKDEERELLFALYDCCRIWLIILHKEGQNMVSQGRNF